MRGRHVEPTRRRDPAPRRWRGAGGFLVALALVFGLAPAALSQRLGLLDDACAAGSADHVALVIDFGTTSVPGAPQGVTVECVPFTPGVTTGLQVLQAHAQRTGLAMRLGPSGIVCGLDAFPSPSVPCAGAGSGGTFRYWSYWRGDASGWTYHNIGPADHRVKADRVEGWRFVDAGIPGEDPTLFPPRNLAGRTGSAGLSNLARNICTPEETPPASTATSPPTTTAAPDRSADDPAEPPEEPRPAVTRPADDAGPAGSGSGDTPDSSSTSAPRAAPGAGAGVTTTTSSSRSVRATAEAAAPVLDAEQVRLARADEGTPVQTIVGAITAGAAIAVLGVAGVRRSRRTRT